MQLILFVLKGESYLLYVPLNIDSMTVKGHRCKLAIYMMEVTV